MSLRPHLLLSRGLNEIREAVLEVLGVLVGCVLGEAVVLLEEDWKIWLYR